MPVASGESAGFGVCPGTWRRAMAEADYVGVDRNHFFSPPPTKTPQQIKRIVPVVVWLILAEGFVRSVALQLSPFSFI